MNPTIYLALAAIVLLISLFVGSYLLAAGAVLGAVVVQSLAVVSKPKAVRTLDPSDYSWTR